MPKSYKKTTVAELRQQCRSRGVRGYSKLPKRGLWDLLNPPAAPPNPIEDVSGAPTMAELQHQLAIMAGEFALKGYGISGNQVIRLADTLDPKETWQALQNDRQDRGGIPDPGSYMEEPTARPIRVNGTTKAPRGHIIVRRKGDVAFKCAEMASHKIAQLKAQGWTFVVRKGTMQPTQAVAARPINGREQAPAGHAWYGRSRVNPQLVQRIGRSMNRAYWGQNWDTWTAPDAQP